MWGNIRKITSLLAGISAVSVNHAVSYLSRARYVVFGVGDLTF